MPDLEQGAPNPYDHDNSVLRPPLSAMSRPRKIRTAGPELGSHRHALPGWAGGSGSRAKRGWREDPERRPGRGEGKTVGRLPDQGHDQGHRQLLRPKRAGGQVCEAGGLSRGPGTPACRALRRHLPAPRRRMPTGGAHFGETHSTGKPACRESARRPVAAGRSAIEL